MLFIDTKRLIPAPFVNFNKEIYFSDDGQPIGNTFKITLQGTLLPNKGSPFSTGWYTGTSYPSDQAFTTDDDRFNSLLAKQELLRETLSKPGFKLTWQPVGQAPIDCYPILRSLNFTPAQWVIRTDYSAELEAGSINRSGTQTLDSDFALDASGYFLSRAADNFQIRQRENNPDVYEISRSISATSPHTYITSGYVGSGSWLNAKAWVDNRISGYGIEANHFGLPTGVGATGLYNFFTDESIDKLGGTYSISQRYIYHNQNYSETRSVSKSTEYKLNDDNGPVIDKITVNGNIQGFDVNNSISGKLAAANAAFAIIATGLATYVGAYGNPISQNVNQNVNDGAVDYSLQFINNSGSFYTNVYDVNFALSDSSNPSVTIGGTIVGLTSDGFYNTASGRFAYATSGWNIIEPTLKSLAFAYCPSIFGIAGYSSNFGSFPINKTVSFNKSQGTITYSYTFGYLDSKSTDNYINQYSVEFNTDHLSSLSNNGAKLSATVNGSVIGIGSGVISTKVNNAISGWSSVKTSLGTMVSDLASIIGSGAPLINYTQPISMVVGVNNNAGVITYSAIFNNDLRSSATGVSIADVSIEDTDPGDIAVVQMIPGRANGPVIQNIGTVSETRRVVNIALTLYPKGGGAYWGFSDKSVPRAIASGYLASGVSDLGARGSGWYLTGLSEHWDWKNSFYTYNANILVNNS